MAYGSKLTQELYFHSPYFFRSLMSSVYGQRQRGERYSKEYHRHLDFLRHSQYLPEKEIVQFRDAQAVRFINEALEHSPYYLNDGRYRKVGSAMDLSGLPILTRNEARDHQDEIVAGNLKSIPHRWAHTSGTTGKSLVFPLSLSCFSREYAFRGLHYEWGGAVLHGRQPFAFCAGHPVTYQDRKKPPFWVYDHANNWLLLSSYHLSEQNMTHYVRELDRFSPALIGGYPSSVYILALAYRKYGKGKVRPVSVYTSSETLFDHQRIAIEEAFQAKVFNWYGNSEMVANIVECEKGELHLKHEHSYLEILDEHDRPCEPGDTGRLVSTGFGNAAFPLIRYDIGDTVTVSENQVSRCGRNGLLIERVDGRNEDYIVTPDGRLVGRLDHLFKDSRNVREAQVCQEETAEVVLRIVRTKDYSEADEKKIMEETRLRLGSEIRIRFEYPEAIERGKNGKFRFIVSTLDQQRAINRLTN